MKILDQIVDVMKMEMEINMSKEYKVIQLKHYPIGTETSHIATFKSAKAAHAEQARLRAEDWNTWIEYRVEYPAKTITQ